MIVTQKQFSFFVFYFNVSNKISSTPPRILNFQELPPSDYKVWKNFPTPQFIPTSLLLSIQEYSNIPLIFQPCLLKIGYLSTNPALLLYDSTSLLYFRRSINSPRHVTLSWENHSDLSVSYMYMNNFKFSTSRLLI